MAVFTTFSREQLEKHVALYPLGDLQSFQPIPEGIENSNYFVTTQQATGETDCVLTLFETLGFNDIPFFTNLMQHLQARGLPVAAPITTLDGMTMTIFRGRPAVLFEKLPGSHKLDPGVVHCKAIGKVLAELHSTEYDNSLSRDYEYDLGWLVESRSQLAGFFEVEDLELLDHLITEYASLLEGNRQHLGQSIIHGDMFRDNALFQDETVTGLIDFYHAGIGHSVLDLAITINDWCHGPEQQYLPDLHESLLDGYEQVRPLNNFERNSLPIFLMVAATKFWIRRAQLVFEGAERKDPTEFRTILRQWHDRWLTR